MQVGVLHGGGGDLDYGLCLDQTDDGGYVVVGCTGCTERMWYGDIILLKTDSNGQTLWTQTYGGESTDIGLWVTRTNDGGYIITGNTWGIPGSNSFELYLMDKDLRKSA
ncbi:hypothetical protein JXM67_03780 [candidate division WOR-3 bacterium]|nr:hypothetical protein [candidate division WOR-3 bacterium]